MTVVRRAFRRQAVGISLVIYSPPRTTSHGSEVSGEHISTSKFGCRGVCGVQIPAAIHVRYGQITVLYISGSRVEHGQEPGSNPAQFPQVKGHIIGSAQFDVIGSLASQSEWFRSHSSGTRLRHHISPLRMNGSSTTLSNTGFERRKALE